VQNNLSSVEVAMAGDLHDDCSSSVLSNETAIRIRAPATHEEKQQRRCCSQVCQYGHQWCRTTYRSSRCFSESKTPVGSHVKALCCKELQTQPQCQHQARQHKYPGLLVQGTSTSQNVQLPYTFERVKYASG